MTQNAEKTLKQLHTLIEYRKSHPAPVDTLGCGTQSEKVDPKTERFQTLISLMLSSMTKDQQTSAAVRKLQQMEGGLNAPNLMKADYDVVLECIKSVGFAKKKAGYIIEAAKICHEKYNDDIPKTLKELTSFNGVGVKMGTLAMAHCWGEQIGIGVDVHVHRISNLLGWVKTKKPDDTELALQKILPKEIWSEVNHTLVGFGQTICDAKKPKCDECPIKDTCPALQRGSASEDDESSDE
ncbi:HhH-GPD superfamily base excision DNA repair protein [Trichomonas vaginalis G3]|uniref:Endonuclease III homolog n=1 Tax=Trichomonas vaginalis (strain ATCC PRA-98 / G3) TaxID=412133 RepID=A2DS55_TRIV3|nr:oxidized pyrimidine nucleobase lesion DNA N-glycosylase protein [Trichomonas vaginalis G3]EAY16825.1 HhH-GPD superfamily base excision DNA repair protein [Trichomonas vaginalis G3]KAI5490764.1 oxidized pyrimidine nucleobase lesion DNA N-glycosylase protein [Trichomonas vaginalis G3]|eukprot:XP_001329048.1 HhH-GPD superfamily base excision DNA repair protein [Trichomonas vaginalis G3]